MMTMASSNTLIHTLVDDDKRGRIMSLYVMAFMGTAPFGSLIAGALSNEIGAPTTILLSGITCLFSAIWSNSFYSPMPQIFVISSFAYI